MADKTMVDYTQKIKPYFEGIAPIEPTTTASNQHAVGSIFYLDGTLVVATSAIEVGDTIIKTEGSTVGNCEDADDIVTQIKNHTVNTDATPTEGSTNPVESNGVYVENRNIYKVMGTLGAKNILPFDLDDIKTLNTNGTWAGNVYTYRGVDFTVNSDGTISATGTATGGNASIKLFTASSNYEMLGKEVILTGCPSNGSASTYRIQAYRMASADGSTGTYFDDGAGTDAFTVLNDASGTVGSFAVAVYENATVTNLLFKPMVRLASDPDNTYQPYAKTNQELTAENQTLANKVDGLETQLDGNYVFVELGHKVTITADGVKTASELYADLANAVITYAQGLENNVRIMIDRLNLYKGNHFPTVKGPYSNNMASFDITAYYIDLNSSGTLLFRHSRVSSNTANEHEYVSSMAVGSAYSFSDISTDVVSSGTELSVTFGVYKSIT